MNCSICHTSITGLGKTGKCRPCSQLGNKRGIGHILTKKHLNTLRVSRLGFKNPMWKGDNVGYASLHEWVRNRKVQPPLCEKCNQSFLKLDLANISQKYKRDLADWEYLCRKCHMIKDGRLKKLKEWKNELTKKAKVTPTSVPRTAEARS